MRFISEFDPNATPPIGGRQTGGASNAERRVASEVRSFAPAGAPVGERSKVAPGEIALRRPSEARNFAARQRAEAASADSVSQLLEAAITDDRALVVIPCLNEEGFLPGVLDMVLNDPGLVDPLVVVADGGSTDKTRQIAADYARRDHRVRLLDNPGRIQSTGVNRSARLADGRRWLVRMDAHMSYPGNFVSKLIEEANRTGANSVVVSMESAPDAGGGVFQRAAAVAQNSVLGAGGSAHRRVCRGQWVDHGHHALFKTDDFIAAGGYDETFTQNEDAEFDVRLGRNGGRIWLSDVFRPKYHPRRTAPLLWTQYFNYGRGRARTVAKHATKLKIRQMIPLSVLPALLLAAASPLSWVFALPALAWAMLALGYGVFLGLRSRDPVAALAGVPAIVMHLAWSAGFWREWLEGRLPTRSPASARPAPAVSLTPEIRISAEPAPVTAPLPVLGLQTARAGLH